MKCPCLPDPCEGYAIIHPEELKQVTEGGIHLVESSGATDKLRAGKIVRCGPAQFIGYRKDGGGLDRRPANLAVDMNVLFNSWSGDTITVAGDDYYLVRHDEIVCVVPECE